MTTRPNLVGGVKDDRGAGLAQPIVVRIGEHGGG